MSWATARDDFELDGDVGGYAGPYGGDPDGAGLRYLSGSIVLDIAAFSGERPEGSDLHIVLHELGHLVGLAHVEDPADTMHATSEPVPSYTAGALRGLTRLGTGPCFLED